MKKSIKIIFQFLLLIALSSTIVEAYSGTGALNYAKEYCGTGAPPDKGYNHTQYVCYNGDKPECRADNPWLKEGQNVDCANFVSQSMINAGADFNGCTGAENIGKGENAGKKGFSSVSDLRSALVTGFCFEAISDPAQMRAKAKPGDMLAAKSGSHVVIYNSGVTYYGHTKDTCNGNNYKNPDDLWSNNVLYHFPVEDKCKECKNAEGKKCQASMEPKCTNVKCEKCNPNSGACEPIDPQGSPAARCGPRYNCNADTGLLTTYQGGPQGCGDDTLTVGAGLAWQPLPATNQSSAVGVLKVGFTYTMADLLQSFKEEVRLINPDELSPALAKEMPFLIIPSAGLYGMEQSAVFKAALESYVSEGGSILVMSQQFGYAYASLPGQVDGYGWLEDQMCFWNSSYIATWHPILAAQTQSTPSIGVDGYFTRYPDNATVLLRRTANGQPDLIMYPYGKGYVIVNSFYTDSAFTRGEASADAKALIRDIVTWAKAPGPIREFRPGQTATINVNVVNQTTTAATAVEVELLDPDKKQRKLWTSISVNLAPGQSAQIPVSYATTTTDPVGIYHIKYNLMSEGYQLLTSEEDPQGTNVWLPYQIQAPREELSGRFAVINPPKTGYQLSGITYAIQSDSFAYINNSIATFTIKIWNNSDVQRTITAKYDDQVQNVTVAAKGLETITYSRNITWAKTGLRATFYDETGRSIGSTFRNGTIITPATKTSTSTNKAFYAKSETVAINTAIQNTTLTEIRTPWQADVKTIIYDSAYSKVFEDIQTVTVQPAQTINATAGYVLPVAAKLGTYTIYTYVLYGNSTVGWAYSRFDLPESRVSVSSNLTPFTSENKNLPFILSNTGTINVNSGALDVSLKDTEGNIVYTGTTPFGFLTGESKTVELPISLPALKIGNYLLTYTQSDETKTGTSVSKTIPNTGWVYIKTDKPDYKIGETANVSILLNNTGQFRQEGAFTITSPALGFTDTRTLALNSSESTSIPYTIPVPVTLNMNVVINAAFALSGGQIQSSSSIYVPPVSLEQAVEFDKPSYRIRETLGMKYVLANNSNFASPLNATFSLSIPDITYSYTSPLIIEPGKKIEIPLSAVVPETLSAGQHQVLASVTLPSGVVHNGTFSFTVPESALRVKMPEAVAYKIGDTVTVSVENVGGLDADSNYYVDLTGIGVALYWNSINDNIQAGASKIYTFQISAQAGSGEYILYASAQDAKTGRWDDSSKTIKLSGLNAGLSVKTDKDIYLFTEDITTLSRIVNGGYQVDRGNLHLQIVKKCESNEGGGGDIPASFYFSTWDGETWRERGVLHYPNTFQTQTIDLSAYLPDAANEYKVRISHKGTGNAEIDRISLLTAEVSSAPNSAFNITRAQDIAGLVHYQDSEAASVLNNEVEVRWTDVSSTADKTILMVAREGSVSCRERVYWHTDIPITQAADAAVDLNRVVNALYLTGQFYLQGKLSSSTGQIIAESEYPFSIIDGNIGLKLKTNKAIYKPGETVTVTGDIVNLSDIEASGIKLEISDGANILYTSTVTIAAKGSSAFSFTTTACVEGVYPLIGAVSQSGNPLVSVGTKYEVSPPLIDPYLYGPDTVGSAPFILNFEVYNTGKVPVTLQVAVTGGSLSDTQEITIPINGSKLLQYSQQITTDTVYTATITGDLNQTLEYTAVFGEKAELQLGAQPAYRAGDMTIPYSIRNIGALEATYPVNCDLTKDGQEVLSTSAGFVLPINGRDAKNINVNLAEGLYVLTCRTTGAQAIAQINVVKTGQARIALNANQIYPEGPITASSVVTNAGLLDETATVTYTLQPTAQAQTKSYYLAKGGSVNDALYYDLKEGAYQLIATSLESALTATADFEVRKENKVTLALSSGAQTDGLIPAAVNLANLGFNSIDGSVQLSVITSQGASVWNAEQSVSQLATGNSQLITFSINPAAITPGGYTLKAELFNNSNLSLASNNQPLSIKGAAIQITQLPSYQTFSPGQDAVMTFKVKNTGNQGGEAELHLKAYDLIDATQRQLLLPGEEKEITFNFLMPTDLEEKDYYADYELKAVSGQQSSVKGQVKYHLAGINIQVNATLDKQSYSVGDTARLTLQITDNRAQRTDLNLFAQVIYGGYESKQPFTLNGSRTLTFDIPLTEITGRKLFYGIYLESGRSLHLNSFYIYKAGDGLIITTDKQVYNPGETAAVAVSSQSGVSGQMTLSISGGTSETFAFTGVASRNFTLPAKSLAGSYFIDAVLSQPSGSLSAQHAIDVTGLDVGVRDAKLDKGKYNPTDSLLMTAKIQSNMTFGGILKASVIDPDKVVIPVGQSNINITSPEEFPISGAYALSTTKAGIHNLMYGVYDGDILLASGTLAFDVGDAVLLSISADKKDYPTNTEPVKAIASMYGIGNATLEIQLDGTSVKTEPVTLNGITTMTYDLPTTTPGRHALKAILTGGDLTSTKESSFVYGSGLADLVPVVTSDGNINPDNTMQLTIFVTNLGVFASGPATVSLYDGASLIDTKPVKALNGGEMDSIIVAWNIAGKTGDHIIKAVVDPQNTIIELNEQNNTSITNIRVPADTTPPTGTILINNGAAYTNNTAVILTQSCTDAGSGCAQMQFSSDNSAWSAPEAYTTTKAWPLTAGDGLKTVYVKYIDGVGNISGAYGAGITLDTVPPVTTPTPAGGLYNTALNVALATNETATIYYTKNGAIPTNASSVYTGPIMISNTTTLKYFGVDLAGNSEIASSATYTIDTIPPVLTLSTLPHGAYTNNATLNIAGTATDNVAVQGLTINDTAIPVNADGTFSQAITLVTGPNTITTTAKDTAGNATTDVRTITLDQNAPVITITHPSDNSVTNAADATVMGMVDETSTVMVKMNSNSPVPAIVTGSTFSLPITLDYGQNTIEATATDLAQNTGTDKRTVTYDNISPSLAVTSPSQDTTTDQSSIMLQGAASDLTAITLTVTHDGIMSGPTITAGMFEQQLTFSEEKTYAVIVTATDAAGNTSTVQRNIIYKKTPPAMGKTTLTYTGATQLAQGRAVTLTATLKAGNATISNPVGKTVTFILGTGPGSQSCAGTTDADGNASCTINPVTVPTGPTMATATFSGDAYYQPSTDTKNVIIFAYPAAGSFVIGDKNAVINKTITFWGSQWWKDNSLSNGPVPASFKGYADKTSATPPDCGGTWSTGPGNSSDPPNSVPSYMAVIVASEATKAGSAISGNIMEIVIVKTNAGYGPDPGHSGTGTVVGVICK